MKKLTILIFFLQVTALYGQSQFVISGKTNLLVNGKAVLSSTVSEIFYPFKIKKDTVAINKGSFLFAGTLKYPEEFRITILDSNHSISEPFFVNMGYHKLTVDSSTEAHDFWEVGLAVSIDKSDANDEYINKYLPLYSNLNKRFEAYFSERNKCNSINDDQTKKGCVLRTEAERLNIRKSIDSVLLYFTQHSLVHFGCQRIGISERGAS